MRFGEIIFQTIPSFVREFFNRILRILKDFSILLGLYYLIN